MKLSLLAILATIVAAKDGTVVRQTNDEKNERDLRLRGGSIRRELNSLMTEIVKKNGNELDMPSRSLTGKGGKGG